MITLYIPQYEQKSSIDVRCMRLYCCDAKGRSRRKVQGKVGRGDSLHMPIDTAVVRCNTQRHRSSVQHDPRGKQ